MEKDEYEKAWAEDGQAAPIENAVEAASAKAAQAGDDEFARAFAESDGKDEEDRKEREKQEAERRAANKKADK